MFFFLQFFARLLPLASASQCSPHPHTPLATPLTKFAVLGITCLRDLALF